MTTTAPLASASKHLADSHGAHLGCIVWGDLEMGDRTIDRDQIRRRLQAASLPVALQPEAVTGQHALGRAEGRMDTCTTHRFDRAERRSKVVLLLRKSGSNTDRTDEAVAALSVDAGGNLVVEHGPRWDVQMDGQAVATFAEHFSRCKRFVDASEFQSTVTRALLGYMRGTRVRRHGSVYWIPAERTRELKAFADVVESFPGCTMPLLEVHDSGSNVAVAGRALGSALDDEIRDTVRACAELASKTATRQATWETRLDIVNELRGRVTSLSAVLRGRDAKLHASLATLESAIRSAVAGAPDAHKLFTLDGEEV